MSILVDMVCPLSLSLSLSLSLLPVFLPTPPLLEWYWKVWMRAWVYRVLALVLIALTVAIIWSEVTFSIQLDSSGNTIHLPIFAALIYVSHSLGSYFSIEVIRE